MLITLIIASIDWSFNTMSLIGKNMTISIHESSLAILRFENSRPGSNSVPFGRLETGKACAVRIQKIAEFYKTAVF